MNRQLRADMMLVLVTLFWGVSYLLMDTALEDLEPLLLISSDFLVYLLLLRQFHFPKSETLIK